MPRSRRFLAALVGVLAAATVLTACNKPIPQITIQSGSSSVLVGAQTYCFTTDVKTCHFAATAALPTLEAKAGDTILVDVPKNIAESSWQVSSATQQDDGTFENLTTDGSSSPVIHNNHSTRLVVPFAAGSYFLIIREQTSSWVARVTIKS